MRNLLPALAVLLALAGSTGAQSIHPPTKEGFGAKQDSPEFQREKTPERPGATQPDASGGANSRHNLDYGKKTQPESNKLHNGQSAP